MEQFELDEDSSNNSSRIFTHRPEEECILFYVT